MRRRLAQIGMVNGAATALLAMAAAFWSGCTAGAPAAEKGPKGAKEQEVKAIKVASVALAASERTVSTVGSLASFDRATLSAKVSGRVSSLNVDLGTSVKQGQTLARIEPRDYELRLQQAEALLAQARARVGLPPDGIDDSIQLEDTSAVREARALLDEAKANRDRVKTLQSQGILPASELDTVDSAYQVAASRHQDALDETRNRLALVTQRRAELEIARQQLTDTTIMAPFDGAIEERRASFGEYVNIGSPIVTIVRMNPLRLRLEIPEREAYLVQAGQTVRLNVEGLPTTYHGQITRLSPAIDQASRILRVEADVQNPGTLRPGAFVRAEIIVDDKSPMLTIPEKAFVTFAGIEKAFIITNGQTLERTITTGKRTPHGIEVIAGLHAGEKVALEPGSLQSGQPVTAVQ